MDLSSVHERCKALASPNGFNFAVSLFILIGILVSYLPQHIRIVRRRSSEGIAPGFVLMGTTSGTCAIANILVLPTSRADMACCKEISPFACAAGLLGVAQVGVQWSCFFVIMLLFLIFFPRRPSTEHHPQPPLADSSAPTLRDALVVCLISITHLLATLIISIVIYAAFPSHLQGWANVLGIAAAVLSCIQYFPQIWTTYHLRAVKSLSIPMMCIQTPGSFVWSASLAARLGPSGWSAWGVYCVTGCLQGVLLGMGVYFEYYEGRAKKKDANSNAEGNEEDSNGHANEETPLLDGERDRRDER